MAADAKADGTFALGPLPSARWGSASPRRGTRRGGSRRRSRGAAHGGPRRRRPRDRPRHPRPGARPGGQRDRRGLGARPPAAPGRAQPGRSHERGRRRVRRRGAQARDLPAHRLAARVRPGARHGPGGRGSRGPRDGGREARSPAGWWTRRASRPRTRPSAPSGRTRPRPAVRGRVRGRRGGRRSLRAARPRRRTLRAAGPGQRPGRGLDRGRAGRRGPEDRGRHPPAPGRRHRPGHRGGRRRPGHPRRHRDRGEGPEHAVGGARRPDRVDRGLRDPRRAGGPGERHGEPSGLSRRPSPWSRRWSPGRRPRRSDSCCSRARASKGARCTATAGRSRAGSSALAALEPGTEGIWHEPSPVGPGRIVRDRPRRRGSNAGRAPGPLGSAAPSPASRRARWSCATARRPRSTSPCATSWWRGA